MEKPPLEWIDKLFNCMTEFFGTRWSKQFSRGLPEDLFKTVWQSALTGLTYDEIRSALVILKRRAQYDGIQPPNHVQFFKYAKNQAKTKVSDIKRNHGKRYNHEVSARAISQIRAELNGKLALNEKRESTP